MFESSFVVVVVVVVAGSFFVYFGMSSTNDGCLVRLNFVSPVRMHVNCSCGSDQC